MTAERACPFISAIRHVSMHVRLIMQQLFVNHPPLPTPHLHSGWINGSDFGPRCVPVYACLLMSSGSVLVSELGPRQPLLQREAVGEKRREDSKSTAKRSLRHGCFMWSEDVRSCTSRFQHTARRLVLPNIHTQLEHTRTTCSLSPSGERTQL